MNITRIRIFQTGIAAPDFDSLGAPIEEFSL